MESGLGHSDVVQPFDKAIRPLAHRAVIEMAADLSADLPSIMGVESEIREALINLVFNAVDAMPNGGSLTLRTGPSADLAQTGDRLSPKRAFLEVTDTGAGMDEEIRRHCLEPFFTTKGDQGSGLGLAMVYGIVQRHNAEVAAGVKAAAPSTPVILLTGWGQRMVAEGNIPAHVDRVLGKPPRLQQLREALARCHQSCG